MCTKLSWFHCWEISFLMNSCHSYHNNDTLCVRICAVQNGFEEAYNLKSTLVISCSLICTCTQSVKSNFSSVEQHSLKSTISKLRFKIQDHLLSELKQSKQHSNSSSAGSIKRQNNQHNVHNDNDS